MFPQEEETSVRNPIYESFSVQDLKNTCKCVSVAFMVQHSGNYLGVTVSGTFFPPHQ